MRAWAIPKPVPSKSTFMAPSVVSGTSVTRLRGIRAQASDNRTRHGFGPRDHLVTPGSWQPGRRAEASMGTVWSSSPWMIKVLHVDPPQVLGQVGLEEGLMQS